MNAAFSWVAEIPKSVCIAMVKVDINVNAALKDRLGQAANPEYITREEIEFRPHKWIFNRIREISALTPLIGIIN